MRSIGIVGLIVGVLMALGLGCSGVSEEEVEQIVAQAVAEAAGGVEQNVEQLIEDGNAEFNRAALEWKSSIQEEVGTTLRGYEDRMNEALLAQKEAIEEHFKGVNAFMDDAEADIKSYSASSADSNISEVERVIEEALSTIEISQQHFVNSLCETDYWITSGWNVLHAMLQYLQGDEDTPLAELPSYFNGLLIDEDYGTRSGVCTVTDDWHWQLYDQPNKVPINRRGT